MEKPDWSAQEFSTDPFTVEDMLNLTEANDPNVPANPTLKAMMRFVIRRSKGPHIMTHDRVLKMDYADLNVLYKRAIDAQKQPTDVPKSFLEGMQE